MHRSACFRVLLGLLSFSLGAHAIGQETCVSFKSSSSVFPIVEDKKATPIFTSADDLQGVHRAATDFASDIDKVTGHTPKITNVTSSSIPKTSRAIIVGTLGKSSLIAQVVNHTKLDVSSIEGEWEAFMTKVVSNPLPGVSEAYVMIGSDHRGTIYAMYDHSEQFGVSPWYWWADVPTTKNDNIFVTKTGCSHGAPDVKYRGLFLNDEQPALQNWAMEKFTNGTGAPLTGSPFNHVFYSSLFELLLRMKANFFWPAQWSSAFAIDDVLNQVMANYYGITMGTSHEEPMTRSIPVEWNLFGVGPWDYTVNSDFIYQFWVNSTERAKPFDWIYTVGMRGNGDEPLTAGTNIPLLTQIISDQRTILSTVFNTSDVTTIPQVWTLYKEVYGYYIDGLVVPDDITLLWTDDNWGNMVRLPIPSEFNRTGGAGVYYHYDYVGDPRDYKWITSSQISKTYEQLSHAIDRHADRIWIVNVGDLKPYEMPIEFFMTMAWDSSKWNPDNLDSFVTAWAEREFDMNSKDAAEVASIIGNVTRYNMRRKPELLNSTLYSLTNYREAENVLAEWESLLSASTKLYNGLKSEYKAAFFEMVHHPVLASTTVSKMWIFAGQNNLRVSQARLSANGLADEVQSLFAEDYEIETQYHQLLGGKWDHMMDQTHVGYFYWQQPMANTMPLISYVQPKKQVLAGIMRISIEGSPGAWPGDNPNQCAAGFNCPPPTLTLDSFVPLNQRFVDVGSGGPSPFTFTASSNVSWLHITPSKGTVTPQAPEQRVELTVDWSKVTGSAGATITFVAKTAGQPDLSVPVLFVANHTVPAEGFSGFVEGDGGVSIEAAHTARNTTVNGVFWKELPGYGKTVSGITPWPRTGNNFGNFSVGAGPSVEYDFFTFNTIQGSGNVTVHTLVAPTLNYLGPDEPVGFAVQLDSQPAQAEYFIPAAAPGSLPPSWDGTDGFIADNIVDVSTTFFNVTPGAHTLKIFMIEPAVIVQKIIVDTGGVRPSYLGPPESVWLS